MTRATRYNIRARVYEVGKGSPFGKTLQVANPMGPNIAGITGAISGIFLYVLYTDDETDNMHLKIFNWREDTLLLVSVTFMTKIININDVMIVSIKRSQIADLHITWIFVSSLLLFLYSQTVSKGTFVSGESTSRMGPLNCRSYEL